MLKTSTKKTLKKYIKQKRKIDTALFVFIILFDGL